MRRRSVGVESAVSRGRGRKIIWRCSEEVQVIFGSVLLYTTFRCQDPQAGVNLEVDLQFEFRDLEQGVRRPGRNGWPTRSKTWPGPRSGPKPTRAGNSVCIFTLTAQLRPVISIRSEHSARLGRRPPFPASS